MSTQLPKLKYKTLSQALAWRMREYGIPVPQAYGTLGQACRDQIDGYALDNDDPREMYKIAYLALAFAEEKHKTLTQQVKTHHVQAQVQQTPTTPAPTTPAPTTPAPTIPAPTIPAPTIPARTTPAPKRAQGLFGFVSSIFRLNR